MLIYEVNLSFQLQIKQAFETWLFEHIEEMLKLPGFLSARLLRPDLSPPPGTDTLSVHYHLESQRDLDHYLENLAPSMRQKGVELFGTGFHANRRILFELKSFGSS